VPYDPEKHHRRSIRLKGYDYSSAGAYFITLCTHHRECIFGEIMDGAMHLNPYGMIVAKNFQWLSERYPYVHLDEWVIMPNHLHGILVLNRQPGRGVLQNAPTNVENTTTQSEKTPKYKSLGRLIGAFKTVSTKRINILRDTAGNVVWQRNYYERIIRDERALNNIRRYIQMNPINWELDRLHRDHRSE
jgi:putative transposase